MSVEREPRKSHSTSPSSKTRFVDAKPEATAETSDVPSANIWIVCAMMLTSLFGASSSGNRCNKSLKVRPQVYHF